MLKSRMLFVVLVRQAEGAEAMGDGERGRERSADIERNVGRCSFILAVCVLWRGVYLPYLCC